MGAALRHIGAARFKKGQGMTGSSVTERLDAELEDFVGRCLIFPSDAWTPNRCRAWVLQHRLNSR